MDLKKLSKHKIALNGEIGANRVVQDGRELFELSYDFCCVSKASQEKHFPSKEFSQPDFCLVFGCLHLRSLYLPCILLLLFSPSLRLSLVRAKVIQRYLYLQQEAVCH